MKTLVILYKPLIEASTDGFASTYFADEKLFAQKSAFERATEWTQSVKNSVATEIVLKTDIQADGGNVRFSALLHRINELVQKHHADFAVYAWADCPFLDAKLTAELIDYHTKYKAEYTFAEGYPYGFAPEIIDAGTLRILSALADSKPELKSAILDRESIFTLLKTDINSFEIETVIAPADWRYLRLKLCCNSKRDSLACKYLFDLATKASVAKLEENLEGKAFPSPAHGCGLPLPHGANELSALAEKSAQVQRTLPAYYNIQLFSQSELQTIYEPPVDTASMNFQHFQKLIGDIADFSDDAVISLSFLGDPLYHCDFLQCAQAVLEHKKLSLLIETDGLCVTTKIATAIKALVTENSVRANGQKAVNWIIRLDAADEKTYQKIHNPNGTTIEKSTSCAAANLATAENAVTILKKLFPDAVYPQMVRMNCNENQLEGFFRRWKADENGELIIQKYDHVSHLLSDERPADLSPAKRYACWHLKRDMNILADGRVVRCKAAAFATDTDDAILGNAFTESLQDVWARGENNLKEQLNGSYKGQCGVSDEYYTFNF